MFVFLFVCPSVCHSIHMSVCLSIWIVLHVIVCLFSSLFFQLSLSLCLIVSLSFYVCPSDLYVYLSWYMILPCNSVCLSVYSSEYFSTCPSNSLYVCTYKCLTVRLFMRMSFSLYWLSIRMSLPKIRVFEIRQVSNMGGRLSTVGLLIKIACFCKIDSYFIQYWKQLIWTSQY